MQVQHVVRGEQIVLQNCNKTTTRIISIDIYISIKFMMRKPFITHKLSMANAEVNFTFAEKVAITIRNLAFS